MKAAARVDNNKSRGGAWISLQGREKAFARSYSLLLGSWLWGIFFPRARKTVWEFNEKSFFSLDRGSRKPRDI